MKTLRNIICTYAVVLLGSLGLTAPSMAGSSDFSGIYGALHASVNGIMMDGTYTSGNDGDDGDMNPDERTQGRAGSFVPIAGYELGFNFPLGDVFFISAGGKWASGKGVFAEGDDFDNAADFTLEVSDPKEYYIAPSVSIFDNSAIFVKFGKSMADLTAIGDMDGQPGNLTGDTYAIGTTTMASNGLFIKSEAGATQYNQIRVTGIGGSGGNTAEGNPLVAYGSVSIGFKF